ncbi:hypothetical protein [Vibrio phage VCPH]|nr:hypothetical protein [Vibrio phage VCPH]
MIIINSDMALEDMYAIFDTMYCMERNLSGGYIPPYQPDMKFEYDGNAIVLTVHDYFFRSNMGGHEIRLGNKDTLKLGPVPIIRWTHETTLADIFKQIKDAYD